MALYSWRLAALLCMIIIGKGRTLGAPAPADRAGLPSSPLPGSCFRSSRGELPWSATPHGPLSASYYTGGQLKCTVVSRPACCGQEIETKYGPLNINLIKPCANTIQPGSPPDRSLPCLEAQLRMNRLSQAAQHLEETWASGSPDLHPGSKVKIL